MLDQILAALRLRDVETSSVRPVDHDIKPGVSNDEGEGEGDAWPALRKRVMQADILVVVSPIWLGQPSSTTKHALERMDAFSMISSGVAIQCRTR